MSFLYPAFLIGAAAIAIPIVLHLLKRDVAPRVAFSAVRFLERVPIEQARRKRLREWLLLALRVAALVLLALAFARPYVSDEAAAAAGGLTVVAVDTSYSLSAPGQLEQARALAKTAVRDTPAGEPIALIGFGDGADVVVEPTPERGAVLAAIDGLAVGPQGTRYDVALRRAVDLLDRRPGRIVLVTDLQAGGWEGSDSSGVPEDVRVEVLPVDAPAGNLAVAEVRATDTALRAVIRRIGTVPGTVKAWLTVDGRSTQETTHALGEGPETEIEFPLTLPDRGAVSVSIEDPEGYRFDNTRHLVREPPAPSGVAVIGTTGDAARDAFYVTSALAADPERQRFELVPLRARDLTDQAAPVLDRVGAALLLSTGQLERAGWERLAAYVRSGGGLLVAGGSQVDPALVSRVFEEVAVAPATETPDDRTFAPADLRHPIFRPFASFAANLGQVRFGRTWTIAPATGATDVIARFSDGSIALAELKIGSGRLLVFGSDLNNEWNDFPLHPGFVPFVHETVSYLVGQREVPSEYVLPAAPPGLDARPGIVRLDESGRQVAVNVDLREANPERLTPEQFEQAVVRLQEASNTAARTDASRLEEEQSLWQYGLLLMLVALAAEGMIGRRAS